MLLDINYSIFCILLKSFMQKLLVDLLIAESLGIHFDVEYMFIQWFCLLVLS